MASFVNKMNISDVRVGFFMNHTQHGLRTPNEAFFHQNPKLLGLGRQIGQINFGAFGVFSNNLSAPILVLYTKFSIDQPLFLQKN